MNYQRHEMVWRNLKCVLLSLEWTSPIKLEKCETQWAFLRSTLNVALNHGYISSRWSGSNWTTFFWGGGGLYCRAFGIIFPQLGTELVLPAVAVQSLTPGPSGKSLNCLCFCFSLRFSHLFIFGCAWSVLLCEGFLCGEWGLLFIVSCGLLTVVASLVVEHGL